MLCCGTEEFAEGGELLPWKLTTIRNGLGPAESCRPAKSKQVCWADIRASTGIPVSLSGFLIVFPKVMRPTVKLRPLSEF